MRPYRGKVKDSDPVISKRWVYGSKLELGKQTFIVERNAAWRRKTDGVGIVIDRVFEVIPKSVGQSTGKRGKNKKEIYEWDILKDDCGEIGIVRFGKLPLDKSGDCVCTYLAYYVECKGKLGQAPSWECTEIGDWMEVIGNIHDNPNFLEEK